MNEIPRIYVELKAGFDLDEEGLSHIKPEWFNSEGEFIPAPEDVINWVYSEEGLNRLYQYYEQDIQAIADQGDLIIEAQVSTINGKLFDHPSSVVSKRQ